MTRRSKQARIRARSPRKHKLPTVKTGPKKDCLEGGYLVHVNALEQGLGRFIPKAMGVRS